ncbi:MAG: hypothetical protein AMXMBFR58_28310 [Phycisphaerae bacterium]
MMLLGLLLWIVSSFVLTVLWAQVKRLDDRAWEEVKEEVTIPSGWWPVRLTIYVVISVAIVFYSWNS